jgi:small conductance mechanosensitive channel
VAQLSQYLDAPQFFNKVVALTPRLVAALLVLLAFWVLFRVTRKALQLALARSGVHQYLVRLLIDDIYRVILLLFAIVMAADQLGFNVTAALTGLGIAGVALGFAAQDSLANVIAGFLIFIDKPFVVDDWVLVSEHYGKVTEITLRSTRIQTPRNTFVVIPNKQIIDQVLVNHTKHGQTRVDVPVGIAYKEHIPQARSTLLAAVRDLEGVSKQPDPDVVVEALGPSSVDMKLRVWVDNASHERPVYYRVMEASKLALDTAGIQIPYHHLQLFVENVDERLLSRVADLRASAGQGEAPA